MLSAAVSSSSRMLLNCGRDAPLSPTPSTFFILKHITYLLCYANEGTASGAMLCERQKEKDPINTKNLDQRAFYYKPHAFLKDSKHDEFLFATEFMKTDGFLCGCFNQVCLESEAELQTHTDTFIAIPNDRMPCLMYDRVGLRKVTQCSTTRVSGNGSPCFYTAVEGPQYFL
ncbi:hypothetical protein STEG23_032361 [Scotinomys teguina]